MAGRQGYRGRADPDQPSHSTPFERTGWPENQSAQGSQQYRFDWFKYQFWRFVFVQQQVAKLAETRGSSSADAKGASFNLDSVKAKIAAARAEMAK